ncbi:hypothetical protein ACFY3B_19325 [Micromonospora parva]|uniref:Uncharacterized protein n=1 Tax=Micromonospora parva TaxID=1464048 RepID=A0ABW6VW72_9ACTN
MTGRLEDAEIVEAYGLAARILLAFAADDLDQVTALVDADLNLALISLITLAAGLATNVYGQDGVQGALHYIATAADLDDIGRRVTG